MKKTVYLFFLIPLFVLSALTAIYIYSKDEPLFFLKLVRNVVAPYPGDIRPKRASTTQKKTVTFSVQGIVFPLRA